MKDEAARSPEDELYEARINFFESFIKFHPEAWRSTSATDRHALSALFFAGRPVDVNNVQAHQRELLRRQPDLATRAEEALCRFIVANDVDANGLIDE